MPCRGKELFPTKFMAFLTSEPGADEDKKKKELLAELQSVNDFLEKSGKPYFGGDDVNALDVSMAPKIKHIKIGADEIKVCKVKMWFSCVAHRQSCCACNQHLRV